MDPLMVRTDEAMRMLGITRTVLFAMLKSGEIESVKGGKNRLVPVAGLRSYVERLRGEQANR